MQKKLIILIISLIIITSGVSTWFILNNIDENPDINNNEKCNILTARELNQQLYFKYTPAIITEPGEEDTDVNIDIEKNKVEQLYPNFSQGDCIILRDTISIIQYSEEDGFTTIAFSWSEDAYTKTFEYYYFEGDITDSYKKDDTVEIKLHLKHVETETINATYYIDIFEEQWQSEQYFIENVDSFIIKDGLKPMNPNILNKI